ncbi:MAG: PEGA domain-containing protein [Lachnospiraceae bacterium]|nr:PEGA domain-containing protein [Lachnospiraceae bacterium]
MPKKGRAALICIFTLLGITVIGGYAFVQTTEKEKNNIPVTSANKENETGFVVAEAGSYDSADTVVVVEKDNDNSAITFQNMQLGKQYTLTYNGATTIYDKHNEAMSMAQIGEGDIVDITFLKSKKRLNSIQLSSEGWAFTDISRYNIDELTKHMTIAEDIYKLSEDTVIVSSGRPAELMDINASDVLKVSGMGYNIYSIVVDKGHGYLRLTNDEYFVGGWIEVGQAVIQEVTEGMLLVVPEGTYDVQISNKGNGGVKKVIINRDEEVELDVGDLKGEEPKLGTVLFTVSPNDATVYIDGEKVDISQAVTLEYGIHQMIVKAEGYDTITQYIKVGQEAAGIDVTMEESEDKDKEEEEAEESREDSETEDSKTENPKTEEPSQESTENSSTEDNGETGNTGTSTGGVSGNGVPSDSTTPTPGETNTTGNYKVYIDYPEGVEVYVDGNYVGVVPCSFSKTDGTHVITLRKTGYVTHSYTVQLTEEDKDVNYSFNDLELSEE